MRQEKIDLVADEFYKYGELVNTLIIIDVIEDIQGTLERSECTISELIHGMKKAASSMILNQKVRMPRKI